MTATRDINLIAYAMIAAACAIALFSAIQAVAILA